MLLSGYAYKLSQPASIFASTSLSDALCGAFSDDSGAVVINVKLSSFMIVLKYYISGTLSVSNHCFCASAGVFGSLLFIKNNQMFNMRRAREKIIAAVMNDVVFFLQESNIASLGDGITTEINDARRQLLQQCCNNVGM